jgi:hypothetical protein
VEMRAFGEEWFEIDTELTRDAIKAGVWTRASCEMADREEDATWRLSVEPLAKKRGVDATAVLGALADTDIDYLRDARRRFITVEETPLGAKIELDDVWRFVPKAWHEASNEWVYSGDEIEEIESQGGRTTRVRQFGSDESLRGDR